MGALFAKKPAALLLVGPLKSGKSTILYQLKLHQVVTNDVRGMNMETVKYKGYQCTVWDISGEAVFKNKWRDFFGNVQGIIYVVDTSNPETLEESLNDLQMLLNEFALLNMGILIFANKQDVSGALPAAQLLEKINARGAKNKKFHVQPSQALTGQGLQEGLDWLAHNLSVSKSS
ncbi:ADP-ribosylation factor 1 [Pelomyxa schiedti]|nr:ADP-ribosylation factor 1 [Pelomyxa schiedti]